MREKLSRGQYLKRGTVENFYMDKMTGRNDSDIMILLLLKSVSTFMSYDGSNTAERWKLARTISYLTPGLLVYLKMKTQGRENLPNFNRMTISSAGKTDLIRKLL